MKGAFPLRDLPLSLDTSAKKPKHRALYEALREAMVHGRLPPGARLPASRDLASQLDMARGTVVEVYEALAAEGYVQSVRGAGTRVAETLPDAWLEADARTETRPGTTRTARLSKRGEQLTRSPFLALPLGPPRPFRPHTPAVEPFPRGRWMQLVARHARRSHADDLRDIDPRGYRPLREAVANHLRTSRGVRCDVEQVVIVAGLHQALDLVARLVLDVGDRVWLEDPGYFGARCVLESAGARIVPVRVDGAGIDVARGRSRAARARLAYVTPAHQAPMGSTLSPERRAELLDWAHRAGAWIFEDDYDSEFRYEGRPLAALQGADERGVVVHAGTFSKALFTGLRLAYVVLPSGLVDPFSRALANLHRFVPLLPQAVLADFIVAGDLGRHLRRMRGIYAERREALLGALAGELGSELEIVGGKSGFELVALLRRRGVSDRSINKLAKAGRIELMPLSMYAIEPLERGGLVLGFAAVPSPRTQRAIPALRGLLERSVGR